MVNSTQLDLHFGTSVALSLAVDGRWEEAVRFPLNDWSGVDSRITHWLKRARGDIAAEITFDTKAFVGLRLRPAELPRAHSILTGLHQRLLRSASGVMAVVDRAVEPRFHQVDVDHAALGVLDRWKSLGHVHVELPLRDHDLLNVHQAGFSLLDAPAPIMLELVFGERGDGWIAARVSTPNVTGGHRLDPHRVRQFLDLSPARGGTGQGAPAR